MGFISIHIGTASAAPPTTNLKGHYDASVFSSVIISTGVSQWNDLCGNGNNLKQAIGSRQPVYTGTGTTSLITFTAASIQFLSASFTLVQPRTVYIVMKQTSWGNNRFIFSTTAGGDVSLIQSNTTPHLGMESGTIVANMETLALGTFAVVAVVCNGSSSSVAVNNNTPTTGNPGSNTGGGFVVGSNSGSGSTDIGVKEIYIYSGAHSTGQQTSIINYLRSKWSI